MNFKPAIIDSHCHIDFDVFDADRQQVLQRAADAHVEKIIVPGVMQSRWQKITDCCNQYTELYACYGLHPYFLAQHNKQHLNDLKKIIDTHKPIAIGECGLDFFLKDLNIETQQFYFEQQLDMALEFNLPVVIHARKSTEVVINAIKKRHALRGMIHSFSGSYEQAIELIKLGFYLSFGGPITYEKSTRLRKLVSQLPLDSLLIETDAPDQPVASAAGSRNEPAFIIEVVQHMAELHNTSTDEIANISSNNVIELFNL